MTRPPHGAGATAADRPPRFSEWLLRASLLDVDRAAVLGDLHEEFLDRAADGGGARARRWYRRQVRRSLLHNLRRRSAAGGLMQDLKFAVRSLKSTPTFTLVALTVLALGVGATTTIFSVVDGVALRGVPYPDGRRLVVAGEPSTTGRNLGTAVPAVDFTDWRAQQGAFEDLGAAAGSISLMLDEADGATQLIGQAVTASLFPILRATPALGRGFTKDDEVEGANHVVILSDATWRSRFGADTAIIGRRLTFQSGTYTVIGVMPSGFVYPASFRRPNDLWTPWVVPAAELVRGSHRSSYLEVVGRLKPGVGPAQAQANLQAINDRLAATSPNWFRNRAVAIQTMQDAIVGSAGAWMLMLLGAVSFVLLIACVNVANLMLARAAARSHDVSVRAALGASRWRIVRGQLAESLVLSIAGTGIGVLLAVWGVHALRAALPPSLPRLGQVAVNYRVLLAAAAAAVVVAVGVTPLWQTPPATLGSALAEGGRSGAAGRPRQRLRAALMIAEVAIAVVLLIGSGLFVTSFVKLMRIDLGFERGTVLTATVAPRTHADSAGAAGADTVRPIFDAVRRLPELAHVALLGGTSPLLSGHDRSSILIPGRPQIDDPALEPDEKYVTGEYFSVLGVPVLRGRTFVDVDSRPGAPATIILNDVCARAYFGTDDPVGAVVFATGAPRIVVGVVRAIRLQGPESEPRPEFYLPYDWSHPDGATLLMRTHAAAGASAPAVRNAIHAAAPRMLTPAVQTFDELFGRLVAQRKFNMIMLAVFGALAIVIAAAGIYGVMACLVQQRTQEIGVRMALGAEPARVLRGVLASAGASLVTGLAVGLAAGWTLSRLVQSFLFRIDAHDPMIYAAAAAVLIVAGMAAAVIPARRAARVDPVIALRG